MESWCFLIAIHQCKVFFWQHERFILFSIFIYVRCVIWAELLALACRLQQIRVIQTKTLRFVSCRLVCIDVVAYISPILSFYELVCSYMYDPTIYIVLLGLGLAFALRPPGPALTATNGAQCRPLSFATAFSTAAIRGLGLEIELLLFTW